MGCCMSFPVLFASRCAAFNWKYHLAGRSASSISMRCGLCCRPSACNSIVRRSCSTNFAKTNFSSDGPKGIQRKMFQHATTSILQWSRVIGVTVVSDENQYFPARMVSYLKFGSTKSMVVVMESASAYSRSNLYGALLELGVCALIRKPLGIGSNCFCFSWILWRLRHHHA